MLESPEARFKLRRSWKQVPDEMKGFIIKKEKAGEYAIPVSNIRKIAIFHIAGKWRVKIDFFNGMQSYMGAYTDEAKAREFYNYCLKQISEWQDKGGENE